MKKKLLVAVLSAFLVIMLLVMLSLALSRYTLKNTVYSVISDKVTEKIKIVQLSDLHLSNFGKNNSRLINNVLQKEPDVILMTGDMVNDDSEEFSQITELVDKLCEAAPLYYSLGNHETAVIESHGDGFLDDIRDAGAVVLEKEYVDVKINGNDVRIGGTSGYGLYVPFWEASYGKDAEEWSADESFLEQRFLLEFENTDALKILMLHKPAATTLWSESGYYDVDLVLSGHTHGGQIVLPFVGGLYAPEEGLFPKYEYGRFDFNGVTTIVSSGLGNDTLIPRINNVPEIVEVTIGRE